MTKQEYIEKMLCVKADYTTKCKDLRRKFVMSNTLIEKNHIVRDHIGHILVEKKGVYLDSFGDSFPKLRIYGLCLKKDLTPRKDKSKRWMYSGNILGGCIQAKHT